MLKKILKWVGIGLGVVLVGAGSFGLYINFADLPHYDVTPRDLKVEVTPARLERGGRLTKMLCAECHMNPVTQQLTGQKMHDLPPEFGDVWTQNITQDKTYGIGDWSDGELEYLLRTGIHRSGRYVPPYMVKLPNMSDEDLHSIIAFLRSDDPIVRAAAVQDTAPQPTFLVKMLSRVAFAPYEMPKAPIATPSLADKEAHGKYLVTNLGCFHCHSGDFKTNDDLTPAKSPGYLGGGIAMKDLQGNTIYAKNITMDKQTGIGNWTETQFVRTLTEGFTPDNKPLRYPMARYDVTPEEAAAIYAYIKTVPVISNKIKPMEMVAVSNKTAQSEGEAIYRKYSCQSCHGETGMGNCDLRQASAKYPADSILIAWIKNPSKLSPGTKMPNWEGVIQENEYAALAAYVRHLGRSQTVTKASTH